MSSHAPEVKVRDEIQNSFKLNLSPETDPALRKFYDTIKPIFPEISAKLTSYKNLDELGETLKQEIAEICSQIISMKAMLAELDKFREGADITSECIRQKQYLNSPRMIRKLIKKETTLEEAMQESSEAAIEMAIKSLGTTTPEIMRMIAGPDPNGSFFDWPTHGVSPKLLAECYTLFPKFNWIIGLPLLAKDMEPSDIATLNDVEIMGAQDGLTVDQLKQCKDPFSRFHLDLVRKGYSLKEIQPLGYPQLKLLDLNFPIDFISKLEFYYDNSAPYHLAAPWDPHVLIEKFSYPEGRSSDEFKKIIDDIIKVYNSVSYFQSFHLNAIIAKLPLDIILDPRFSSIHLELLKFKKYPWEKIAPLHSSQLLACHDSIKGDIREKITLEDVDNDWWTPRHYMAIHMGTVSYQEIKGMDGKQLEEYLNTPCRHLNKRLVKSAPENFDKDKPKTPVVFSHSGTEAVSASPALPAPAGKSSKEVETTVPYTP